MGNKFYEMGNIKSFIDSKFNYILLSILIIMMFKTCSLSSDVASMRKEIKKINSRIDSIPNKNDLKIEGLKNEKRMIQSTDRRILDVNRENEIEEEIKSIQGRNDKQRK